MFHLRDPATKQRLSEMRSAGHYWGARDAAAFLKAGGGRDERQADARMAATLEERQGALLALGADIDDLRAWSDGYIQNFMVRVEQGARKRRARG